MGSTPFGYPLQQWKGSIMVAKMLERIRIKSWSKFVSEAYWNVELAK